MPARLAFPFHADESGTWYTLGEHPRSRAPVRFWQPQPQRVSPSRLGRAHTCFPGRAGPGRGRRGAREGGAPSGQQRAPERAPCPRLCPSSRAPPLRPVPPCHRRGPSASVWSGLASVGRHAVRREPQRGRAGTPSSHAEPPRPRPRLTCPHRDSDRWRGDGGRSRAGGDTSAFGRDGDPCRRHSGRAAGPAQRRGGASARPPVRR